jgi:hypothetical protein
LKNKIKLIGFAVFLIFIANANANYAQTANTPEQTAKSFYEWYLGEINSDRMPNMQKATFNKYVSKRLSRWRFSKAYEEYGADYFVDAQDSDERWRVTTGKAVIKGNAATLKVKLAIPNAGKSDWTNNLTVKMVLENGAWKIDSVNNRALVTN